MGYAAAREWRRVQVERPRASTSGGHWLSEAGYEEEGRVLVDAAEVIDWARGNDAGEVEDWGLSWELELDCAACLERARHEAADVQVRHLEIDVRTCNLYSSLRCFACLERIDTYGLPSLSSTTPLGRLASEVCSSLVGSGIVCVDALRGSTRVTQVQWSRRS